MSHTQERSAFFVGSLAIKKPPIRRKRKHNSVDVSYSVFKLLFADHRGQRTSSVGYSYAQKNDVLLAAPPRSEEKLPTAYRCLYENRRNGTGIVRDVLGSTRPRRTDTPDSISAVLWKERNNTWKWWDGKRKWKKPLPSLVTEDRNMSESYSHPSNR